MAKGLRDFARTNPLLVIKGGVLDGKLLTPDEVRKLADLESREVLLAKVAGGMQGILQQAISLIAAPLSQAARLFAALEQAAEENPSLLAALPTDVQPEPTNAELAPTAEDTSRADQRRAGGRRRRPPPSRATKNSPLGGNRSTRCTPAADRRRGPTRQHPLRKTTRKERPSWRSSAPPSSLTLSRSSP